MTRLLPLCLIVLSACGVAGADEMTLDPTAPVAEPSPDVSTMGPLEATYGGLTLWELSRVDVRGTSQAIDIVLQDVESMSPEHRAEASAALAALSVNCPYTRASVQLPLALHRAVMEIDAERLDGFVQGDWAYLQDGLTTHVAVLHALGADLPAPQSGDYLYGRDDGVMIDGKTLASSADPIAASAPLLEAIQPLVDEIDGRTLELIRLNGQLVEARTGHATPLAGHVSGWGDALRRIEPFVTDPELQATIRAMIEPLQSFNAGGC